MMGTGYAYPNLCREFGWNEGVHRSMPNYQHPWLVCTREGTSGWWTREEARGYWTEYKEKYR